MNCSKLNYILLKKISNVDESHGSYPAAVECSIDSGLESSDANCLDRRDKAKVLLRRQGGRKKGERVNDISEKINKSHHTHNHVAVTRQLRCVLQSI